MRLKFEIAERILSESNIFFYFRLFMISDFLTKRQRLVDRNLDKEKKMLSKLTPLSIADNYKNIMFELCNSLEIAHHEPD